jgi:Ribbon-helix-helix protein, copG family
MIRTSIYLSENDHAELQHRAAAWGLNTSQTVRVLLRHALRDAQYNGDREGSHIRSRRSL